MSALLRELIRLYCHYAPIDRGKYRLACWAYQHLKSPAKVIRTRLGNNLPVEVDPSEFVQSQIYYIGYYELYLARFVRRIIKPSMVFVDVGAHVGQYTLLAAERGAAVHAFEPHPQNYLRLQRNINLNHLSHVSPNKMAVSDRLGTTMLFLPDNSNTGSGSLRRVSPNTINSITVSTTTLDAYFAPLNIGPHVIKLDIEGAELLALRGAEGVLRTFRPILVVEASKELMHAFGYGCGDLIDFLRAVDYHLYTLNYSALKPIPTEYRSGYENLICLPRDSSSYTALTSSGIRPI